MMRIRKRPGIAAAFIIAASPFVSMSASAEALDGSSDIVCAVMEVVGCVEGGKCLHGQARHFDLPELVIFDAKNKVIRGSDEAGHKEVSSVKNMEKSGNHLVLQGVEEDRGWDMAINTRTGSMNAAVVGDALGLLVSGICTGP